VIEKKYWYYVYTYTDQDEEVKKGNGIYHTGKSDNERYTKTFPLTEIIKYHKDIIKYDNFVISFWSEISKEEYNEFAKYYNITIEEADKWNTPKD
jgi:hypothetical protein